MTFGTLKEKSRKRSSKSHGCNKLKNEDDTIRNGRTQEVRIATRF